MNLFARYNRTATGRSESGVAIVEFALVLPILILLTFCVMELVHTTSAQKVVTQLSREAANVAFRECAGYSTDTVGLQNCLNRERSKMELFAHANIDPGVVVVLSYYELGSIPGQNAVKRAQSTPHPDALYATRFTESNGQIRPQITALDSQGIYVSEIFLPYNAIIRRFLAYFRYDLRLVYDATVA